MKLAVCLVDTFYGSNGAQIIEFLFHKGRANLREIVNYLKWPVSVVYRTLVLLCYKRFVLTWQEGGRPCIYSANFKEIYKLFWSGDLLSAADKDEQEMLLYAVQNAPINVEDAPENIKQHLSSNFLRPLQPPEFLIPEELLSSCLKQVQSDISSDLSTMGLSETAKAQQVQMRLPRAIQQRTTELRLKNPPLVVNWTSVLVQSRHEELVEYAKRQIGSITAEIYKTVLELTTPNETHSGKIDNRRFPNKETVVTTTQILTHLKKTETEAQLRIRLESAFMEPRAESSAKRRNGVQTSASAGPTTLSELLNRHLTLLTLSPNHRFLQRVGTQQFGEWFVDFQQIVNDLKRNTFDSIVKISFGQDCLRLLRIIRSTGKLDEKMLATKALLPALAIRQCMTQLSSYGFADVQELSKQGDQKAQPNQKRSVYLWHHRADFSYKQLVLKLYDQLEEQIAMRAVLRTEHKLLISKLCRTDVASNMELLTPEEQTELSELKNREQSILTKICLLDRTVRIFTEY